MTLGEKIKCARKCYGLSQEQLAGKLCVSRSAIAKWETDKGMPDVENLKMLSKLFGMSVDALLDDADHDNPPIICYPCDLSAYGKGCTKVKVARMLQDRFPDARICHLLGRPTMPQDPVRVDSTRGILTPSPFGSAQFIKSIRDTGKEYYLVEQEETALFVAASQSQLEICPLPSLPADRSFQLGGWSFVRLNYLTKE